MNRNAVSFDVSDRPLIEFTGTDRAKSLHNLTTQDIKGLSPGTGAEAFVTSPQGKTLGFFTIHVGSSSILLRCDPGGESLALAHFAKYTIFDDVSYEIVTDRFEQRLWLGTEAVDSVMGRFFAANTPGPNGIGEVELPEAGTVRIVRTDAFQVPGLLIIAPKGKIGQAETELARIAGIEPRRADSALLDRLRVLAAWPHFGADIQGDNLPQEIDRDETAICFRKGCYLGQETVARLDALGHVNRILRGFVLDADHVPVDATGLVNRPLLNESGQQVGEIRSSARGENDHQAVGLALIRVKAMEGAIRVADLAEANLTLLKPAEFRERLRPLAESLTAASR